MHSLDHVAGLHRGVDVHLLRLAGGPARAKQQRRLAPVATGVRWRLWGLALLTLQHSKHAHKVATTRASSRHEAGGHEEVEVHQPGRVEREANSGGVLWHAQPDLKGLVLLPRARHWAAGACVRSVRA